MAPGAESVGMHGEQAEGLQFHNMSSRTTRSLEFEESAIYRWQNFNFGIQSVYIKAVNFYVQSQHFLGIVFQRTDAILRYHSSSLHQGRTTDGRSFSPRGCLGSHL